MPVSASMYGRYEEKFYEECAKIIELIDLQKSSLKNLLYKSCIKDKRKMLALLSGYFIMEKNINKFFKNEKIFKKGISNYLLKILAFEYYYGYSKNRLLIKKLKDIGMFEKLKNLKVKVKGKYPKLNDTPKAIAIKYIRINNLKMDEDVAIKAFCKQGYNLSIHMETSDYLKSIKINEGKDNNKFYKDLVIPNLYIFPPNTDFHENELYTSGAIIIQDKFSCIPSLVLNPEPGCTVIDACAAPGNKTSHLASLMKNKGQLFAIEMDPNRFNLLKSQMWKFAASCVTPFLEDFTALDPDDSKYKDVTHILVDPSCSGTGMVSRIRSGKADHQLPTQDRLTRLRNFQFKILDHAFKFPAVERIVYSTCSIMREENEMVIEEIYAKHGEQFRLMNVMGKEFPHLRGIGPYKWCKKCLRSVKPPGFEDTAGEVDAGNGPTPKDNGIFVAMFERKMSLAEVAE